MPECEWCNFTSSSSQCDARLLIAEIKAYFHCTRVEGHHGPHVACSVAEDEHNKVQWGNIKIKKGD